MARIIKIGLAAAALSVGTLAIVVGTKGVETIQPITAAGSPKSISLTNDQLKNVPLVSYVFDGEKVDKIFRIPLDNGAYIDGAILFNDCGYQYTGTTLGDAFGLHNRDEKPNAYNFNILFSFDCALEMSVNVEVHSDHTGSEESMLMAKFAHIEGDFYNVLKNTAYSQLVGPAGSSDFYKNDTLDFNTKSFSLDGETTQNYVYCQPHSSFLNVAAFQFAYANGNYIDNGNEITCALKSLSFDYSCN